MKKHFCEIKHNPPKQWGDCFRACISSITEIEMEEVPNFCEPDADWPDNLHHWLRKHGMGYVEVGFCPPDGRGTLRWILAVMEERAPNTYYILSGQSQKWPETNHSVVCIGGKLAHNPSSKKKGEFGISGPSEGLEAFLIGFITAGITVKG